MILLAADTSTSSGSVAMRGRGGELFREDLDPSCPHSRTLLPAVEKLLGRAGLLRDDVQAIAVGTGPGAFTGLRVGLATFKAWAGARGLPLIPVVSMDAVALPVLEKGVSAVVLMDARKGEVYAAYYPSLGREALPRRTGDVLLVGRDDVREWITSLRDPRARVVGTGLSLLAERDVPGDPENIGDGSEVPDATSILVLAETLLTLGRTVDPTGLVPFYVRPPDARKPAPGTTITRKAGAGEREDP